MKRDYRELRQLANEFHDRFSELNYDTSMSLSQKFNVLLEYFRNIAKDWEEVLAYLREFEEKFDEKLYETVEEILLEWLANGTMESIIRDLVIKLGDLEIFRPFDKTVMEKIKNEFYERGLNIKWFGAIGDGVTDDSQAIQSAIDFANDNFDYQKRPKVIFPSGHTFCGVNINMKSSVVVEGKSEFKVINDLCGNPKGFKFYNVLYSGIKDLKILLSDINQIAIEIDTLETSTSSSQFNNFDNVIIEGDTKKDTIGLNINKTWSNTFTNCKILRCADGITFNNADSNANFFYGCEIRHNYLHENSKTALIHRDGKNNVFRDGIIESYQDGIYVKNGNLTLDSVYTETIAKDRGITLADGNGILTINNCLLKTKVNIYGGRSLTVTNCDMSQGAMPTNYNSPFVLFTKDVKVKVLVKGNTIPTDFFSGRFGQFLDVSVSPNQWSNRSRKNLDEKYLDRDGSIVGVFPTTSNATGDGTVFRLNFVDELIQFNPNNELSVTDNVFKPVEKGLYEISIRLRIGRVNNTHTSCRVVYRERGVGQKSVTLGYLAPKIVEGESIVYLSGTVLFETSAGLTGNFELDVAGTDKIIYVDGNTDSSILNQFTITRIA